MGTKPGKRNEVLSGWSCFFGGMLSVTVQTVVLRESLFGEHQAELASGIVLASWILGSGLGAALAGRSSRHLVLWRLGVLLLPLLGILQVTASRILDLPLFLSVFPLGLAAGAVFIHPFAYGHPGRIYALEALGAAAGGGLFVILSPHMLAGSVLGISVLIASAAIISSGSYRTGALMTILVATGFLLGAPGGFSQELGSRAMEAYEDVTVLPSPYGEITAARRMGQHAVFRAGILEATWPARESAEAVMVVPLAAALPGTALYIGSSPEEASILAEWPTVDSSVTVIPDAALAGAAEYPPGTLSGDGREYLSSNEAGFDLVVVSTGQPLTLLANRFFTEEFMEVLSGRIRPGGVAAVRLPGGANRLHPLEARLARSFLEAAREHFDWVEFVPISGLMALMGNGAEPCLGGEHLAARLDSIGFAGVHTGPATLPYDLAPIRIEAYRDQIRQAAAEMNRDLHPEAFRLCQMLWDYREGRGGGTSLALPAALLLVAVMAVSSFLSGRFTVTMGVAGAGFAGLSVEVISIVAVQAATGYSWFLVGAVTGLFMTGASLGALYVNRGSFRNPRLFVLVSGMTALMCALFLQLYDIGAAGGFLLSGLMLAGTFGCGFASGGAFTSAAARLAPGRTGWIGLLSLSEYSASAAAGLLVPLVLFPAVGAVLSLVCASVLCLTWALLMKQG